MATATVSNITNFGGSASGADAGWGNIGGGPGGGQNTDDFIEGTDSFGGRKTATGQGIAYTAGAGVDMSTTSTHIYTWINCKSIGALDLISNGGLTLRVGSSATNYRSFYIGGSDTVKAGWQVYVIDPTKTGSVADTGTPDMTSVTYIGVELTLSGAVGGTSDNILMDVIRYTTGPYVTGGTTGDRLLWSDIAATDASNAYGIIQERSGVYFAAGQVALGAPAATAGDCYLDDGGQVVVWEPKEYHNGAAVVTALATDFNSFVIQEGTGTTDVEDGNLVGTGDARSGTVGSVFQKATEGILGAANTNDLRLSIEGAITAVDFHGSTFKRFDRSVTLSNDATDGPNHVFAGCAFTESEQVVANRPVYRNCVFSSYRGTDAALLWNANVNIKNSSFLSNADGTNDPAGIEYPNTGTFTHDGLTFNGNDFDVYNSSGGLVTIDVINGSDTSTDRTPTGTTTINVSVPVSLTAIVEDLSFDGAVHVDAVNGTAGTGYPQGTILYPINNFDDAVTVANLHNITTLHLISDFTIPASADLTGFHIFGEGRRLTTVEIDEDATLEGCVLRDCYVTGVLDNESSLIHCTAEDLEIRNGNLEDTTLLGTITLSGNANAVAKIIDCWSGVPGTSTPIIDMGGAAGGLSVRGYHGGLTLRNKTGADAVSVDMVSGQLILEATVTAGTIVARGIGKLLDSSVGATVIDEMVDARRLRLIEKIQRNRLETNPTTGTLTIYDDDGVTPLVTSAIYEDIAGTQTYRSQGVDRRNRLT